MSGRSPAMAVTNSIFSCFILVFALYFHHRINAFSISDVNTTYLTNGVQFSNKRSHNIRENDVAFHHYSRHLTTWCEIQISCTFSMLLLCGDVMENPGPSVNEDTPDRFTCWLCSLDVSRKDCCLCCDNCDRWFHRHCQNLVDIHESPESDYIIGGVAWSCALCGCPNNFTIFCYHTVDVSNRFEQLSDLSSCFSSISSPGAPITTSSPNVNTTESFGCSYNTLSSLNTGSQSTLLPSSRSQRKKARPVCLLNLNAQSIRNKKAEFCNLIETTVPDITLLFVPRLGSTPTSQPAKYSHQQQQQYNVFRRDREQSQGGGMFVAVSRDYTSTREQKLETNYELLWVKISLSGCKDLHVCIFYHPHEGDKTSMENFVLSVCSCLITLYRYSLFNQT